MASEAAITTIRLPIWLWARLIFDLRRRGAGQRESGAFLLGHNSSNPARVVTYLCYDDIDAEAYQSGAIAFHAIGYAALWQHCKEKRLQVFADVHTHAGADVRQSAIDQRNPMVPIIGHTALVVPHFARTGWWSFNSIGVYEYLGNFKWRAHQPTHRPRRVKLSLW